MWDFVAAQTPHDRWRALARALSVPSEERKTAVRDALAFRAARRALYPGSAEDERDVEITEGLAHCTGIVVTAPSPKEHGEATTKSFGSRASVASYHVPGGCAHEHSHRRFGSRTCQLRRWMGGGRWTSDGDLPPREE